MGQKVNPISMRLQVNKDWRSKWFVGKREYAKYLADDLAVRRMIQNKCFDAVESICRVGKALRSEMIFKLL